MTVRITIRDQRNHKGQRYDTHCKSTTVANANAKDVEKEIKNFLVKRYGKDHNKSICVCGHLMTNSRDGKFKHKYNIPKGKSKYSYTKSLQCRNCNCRNPKFN